MALKVKRTMRLSKEEYFPSSERKTGIAIHHTVGGSAASTFNWWMSDWTKVGTEKKKRKVGTAYIIGRDGTIYEIFDPAAWAWQFGLGWPKAKKIRFEKRFIGIEIASEGGLIESGGKLYCFDRISSRTVKKRAEAFDLGRNYRGYRYFDKYEDAQVDSLLDLVNHLCDTFHIKRQVPDKYFDYYGESLSNFEGIIGHTMVRKDKSDPAPDKSLWDRIVKSCGVVPTTIGAPKISAGAMTDKELDDLFEHNVQQINKMDVAAGSMVKGLIMELERGDRRTYIKLIKPVEGGHAVSYKYLQGDMSLVGRVARALGFKTVTDSRLEVRSA